MTNVDDLIVEIQELVDMGISNKEIAKEVKLSLDFVTRIVHNMFEWEGLLHEEDA